MLKRAFAVAALGAAVALPMTTFAQPAGTAPPVSADPNSESGASYRATDLLNQQVKSEDGKVLADIEDFVLDSQTNQVQYLVLSYGGADGQFVVVPFTAVDVRYQGDTILVQSPLTVDVLKAAPTFAANQWATVIRRPNWYNQVNTYWTNAGFTVGVGPGGVGGVRAGIGGRGAGIGVGGRGTGARGPNVPGAGNLNDRPGAGNNTGSPRPGADPGPGAVTNPRRPGGSADPGRPSAGSNPARPGNDSDPNAPGVGTNPGRPGAGSAPGAGSSPRTPGGPGPQNPGAGDAGAPPSAPGAGSGAGAGAGAGGGGGGS